MKFWVYIIISENVRAIMLREKKANLAGKLELEYDFVLVFILWFEMWELFKSEIKRVQIDFLNGFCYYIDGLITKDVFLW